jgi:hypothetical protein
MGLLGDGLRLHTYAGKREHGRDISNTGTVELFDCTRPTKGIAVSEKNLAGIAELTVNDIVVHLLTGLASTLGTGR